MALWIQETFLNETEGYMFGETEVYETYADTRGELFRDLLKEYGRCVSRMYVDTADGAKTVGWVFRKRMSYEDQPERTYVREVWVSVHSEPPTKTVTYHYAED